MSEQYQLTESGGRTALGVISSICHGYDLEQTAALNGLDSADDVRVMLLIVAAEAGLLPPIEMEDE